MRQPVDQEWHDRVIAKLREEREALGLSRAVLAEKLETTGTTVYRWETGKVIPSRASVLVWQETLRAVREGQMREQIEREREAKQAARRKTRA